MEETGNMTLESLDHFDVITCGQSDNETLAIIGTVKFWFEGVFFMSFGVIGLISALTTVGILTTRELRSHLFYQLLITLAILDILYILCSVPTYSFDIFKWFHNNKTFHHVVSKFLYPLTPVTLHATIFLTIALTLERYIAVHRPFWFRNINTSFNTCCRLAMYVLPAILLSFAFNYPKFSEVTVSDENDTLTFDMTEKRKSPNYLLYYTISLLIHPTITTGIAPLAIHAFMNASILLKIHKSRLFRGITIGEEEEGNGRMSENNLAFVLVGVVVIHFVCHIPRFIFAIAAQSYISIMISCVEHGESFYPPLWIACGESVTAMFLLVKSSFNLLMYCFTLRRFKAKIGQIGHEGKRKITNYSRSNSVDSAESTFSEI